MYSCVVHVAGLHVPVRVWRVWVRGVRMDCGVYGVRGVSSTCMGRVMP